MDINQQDVVFVPYSYLVSSTSLAGGASNQQPLLLDADADFELHWVAASTTNDNPNDPRPNYFSVQITDKNNSRIWSNARILQVMLLNWESRRPVLLAKRSNLNFDFLNTTAATTLTATVVLHGFKVYKIGA